MIVFVGEGKAGRYSIDRIRLVPPKTWQTKAKVKVGTKLYYFEDPADSGKIIVATRDLTKDKEGS